MFHVEVLGPALRWLKFKASSSTQIYEHTDHTADAIGNIAFPYTYKSLHLPHKGGALELPSMSFTKNSTVDSQVADQTL